MKCLITILLIFVFATAFFVKKVADEPVRTEEKVERIGPDLVLYSFKDQYCLFNRKGGLYCWSSCDENLSAADRVSVRR